MKESLEESFQYFLGQAQELGRLYRTVRELYIDDTAMIGVMNSTAPGFFAEVLNVYSDAIALSMARICDEASHGRSGRKNLSVKRYMEALDGRGQATEALRDAARELLGIADRAELKVFRHRYLAHSDEPTALEQFTFRLPQWHEIEAFVKYLETFTFEAARILKIDYHRQLMTRSTGRHVPLFRKYLLAAKATNVEWSFAENWNSRFYRSKAQDE